MRTSLVVILLFITLHLSISFAQEIPTIVYKHQTIVDDDYVFNNEGLNVPTILRVNHATDELVVIDIENDCIYFFTKEGEFLRKSGRYGEGPGEFLWLSYLAINPVGEIYIHDMRNQRISILSKDGSFINSFRSGDFFETTLSINNNIISNIPTNGYFITVLNNKGKIEKHIGKYPRHKVIENSNVLANFGQGWAFLDSDNCYYFFAMRTGIVYKFDGKGALLYEKPLENIPYIKTIRNSGNYMKPKKMPSGKPTIPFHDMMYEVLFYNERFYLLIVNMFEKHGEGNDDYRAYIYELDKEFNINKRILLDINNDDVQARGSGINQSAELYKAGMYIQMKVDYDFTDGSIYYPHRYNSKIYRFSAIKN
ncbi:6-bladed beta-propeller [candidate division KSB1 bacterium]